MKIEQLEAGAEGRLRAIRLRALEDAPKAFGSTLEEVRARPRESWTEQLMSLPTFVAVRDGVDVGVVRYAPNGNASEEGTLVSLWVAPDARGQGVGEALIDACVTLARSRGVGQLSLDVGDDNAAAIALYERKGFVPTGETSGRKGPSENTGEHRRVLVLRRVP